MSLPPAPEGGEYATPLGLGDDPPQPPKRGDSLVRDAKAGETLSGEEKIQIKAVFEKLDRDGSGYLDKMEIIIGLKEMNHPDPSLASVEKMLGAVGLEDSDEVSLEEFEIMWKNRSDDGWTFAGNFGGLVEGFASVGIAVGGGFFGAAAAAVDATTNTAGSVAAAAGGGGGNWVDTAGGEAPRGIPIDEKQYRDVYDIAGEIGSGAYSKVYEAKKLASEGGDGKTKFAIKVVQKADIPEKEDLDALLEEVGILQQIHHPNVMHLFGFYEDKSTYALVTEMVVGGELFDRVVELQHYNEEIGRDLVATLLSTLEFLHSNGIVHRDLKPENLLLATHESHTNIKLADFGFAKHTSQRLDTVCGTPDYIAPEVCALLDLKNVPRAERPPYNEKCDIWSAGVIVFILLGGYPPFYDDNRKKLFAKIKKGHFEFHEEYWGDSSPEAKDLISQMLTVDPKLRPSAKELLKHPWLQASAEVLRSKDLASTKVEMKKWAARRRLKAAVTSVVAIRRMTTLLGRR